MTAPSDLPTGPFPVIEVEPTRYDDTRRRARARRARRTSLLAAASVAVVALGAGLFLRGGGTTRQTSPLGGQVSDAELVAMTDCDAVYLPCQVVSRIDLKDGRTFAVIGHFSDTYGPGISPDMFLADNYVLADGTTKVAVGKPRKTDVVRAARADAHGNVLVPFGVRNVERYDLVPVAKDTATPRLELKLPGRVSGFSEFQGDLAVVSTPPDSCSNCLGPKAWRWEDGEYKFTDCTPEGSEIDVVIAPRCGPVEVPEYAVPDGSATRLTWQAQAGCPIGCADTSVVLASGHTLHAFGTVEGYKLVLTDGDRFLGALPSGRFTLDHADHLYVDSTGHALLSAGGSTAHWIIPIGERNDAPVVLQGGLEDHLVFKGDNNTSVKDADGDGNLEILVTEHEYATATAPYKLSTTTYSWNGTEYVKTGCAGALC